MDSLGIQKSMDDELYTLVDAKDEFLDFLGVSPREWQAIYNGCLGKAIYPADAHYVCEQVGRLSGGLSAMLTFRITKSDKKSEWVHAYIERSFEGGKSNILWNISVSRILNNLDVYNGKMVDSANNPAMVIDRESCVAQIDRAKTALPGQERDDCAGMKCTWRIATSKATGGCMEKTRANSASGTSPEQGGACRGGNRQFGWSSGGIGEYVFRALYGSADTGPAIQSILGALAGRFGFSHGFIVERNGKNILNVVYEWNKKGDILLANDNSLCLKINDPGYFSYFDQNDVLSITGGKKMPACIAPISDKTNAKSVLQFAYRINGKHKGALGFIDDKGMRGFSPQDLDGLRCAARIIGVFLDKKRSDLIIGKYAENINRLLDSISDSAYVVDPLTHKVAYVNINMQRELPMMRIGSICHKAYGNNTPCPDCPLYGTHGGRVPRGEKALAMAQPLEAKKPIPFEWADGITYYIMKIPPPPAPENDCFSALHRMAP
jgi:hypothetical protein